MAFNQVYSFKARLAFIYTHLCPNHTTENMICVFKVFKSSFLLSFHFVPSNNSTALFYGVGMTSIKN